MGILQKINRAAKSGVIHKCIAKDGSGFFNPMEGF